MKGENTQLGHILVAKLDLSEKLKPGLNWSRWMHMRTTFKIHVGPVRRDPSLSWTATIRAKSLMKYDEVEDENDDDNDK